MSLTKTLLCCLLLCSALVAGSQQYQLNGNAVANSCNCYTLTQEAAFQSGSAWNKTLFDLNNPFDFRFSVNLGCKDATGADGIVFMLQQMSTSLGASGGGMGFDGVSPSVGILLDTWQNPENNDPVFDHISIQANGVLAHGTDLAGPVRASATSDNIEDCAWHIFRVTWDPVTHQLRAYFDGDLRVEATINLISNIFNNNPLVYWGFTAATGGSNNLQQFCTALAPKFSTGLSNNNACIGQTVTFTNQSEAFAPIQAYHWDFGDGTTSSLPTPPAKLYAAPGNYFVKLALTGFDGCTSDTLTTLVSIGDIPVANFSVFDTCAGITPRIIQESSVQVGGITKYTWWLNGSIISNAQVPQLTNLTAGDYTLQLQVESANACISPTVSKSFTIKAAPQISATVPDGCVLLPITHTAVQTDNQTNISSWNWTASGGTISSTSSFDRVFSQPGNYQASVYAVADNGCSSNVETVSFFINEAKAFAGNDTIFIKDEPFQLNGSGGVTYSWWPATGLNDAGVANPIGLLQDDMRYTLTVTTAEGCIDSDDIFISIFKESKVYVPTGFTPNNDGKNDLLMPYLIGIRQLEYFSVYNRWGQEVFTSKQPGQGWDGRLNGTAQPSGVYVWRIRAIDYVGKVYELSGTVTLIR